MDFGAFVYFFVTHDLIEQGRVTEAFIDNDIPGSDHCPIGRCCTCEKRGGMKRFNGQGTL